MRGFFIALVVGMMATMWVAPAVQAAGNPRYAALVMDADTGQILFEDHARDKRYPASLTKMMTLYMVFDALESGAWTLDKKLTASKKAASQPQTNIALRPGDQITVEQCIKALVTRSANDAAYVLAEALGKTDWNFGVMMTNKARMLGMKNSVFRNPNGLPDSRQFTTAYDMAILGVALRRDFPQYFNYFTTRSFTYKGRTYGSHNRVLDRFSGVDGIKTGYINASGFNLVSSVKRDGISMVAVVMGGVTATSRDNHMVELLKKNFTVLAEMKKNPTAFASSSGAPTPLLKPEKQVAADVNSAVIEGQGLAAIQPSAKSTVSSNAQTVEAPKTTREPLKPQQFASGAADAAAPVTADAGSGSKAMMSANEIEAQMPASKEDSQRQPPRAAFDYRSLSHQEMVAHNQRKVQSNVPQPTPAKPMFNVGFTSLPPKPATPNTLEYQYALLDTNAAPETESASRSNDREWGIQVGAFSSESQAREAVSRAMKVVEEELKNAYMNISSNGRQQAEIHRARLGNLSRTEAENACRKLNAINSACFPLRIN